MFIVQEYVEFRGLKADGCFAGFRGLRRLSEADRPITFFTHAMSYLNLGRRDYG